MTIPNRAYLKAATQQAHDEAEQHWAPGNLFVDKAVYFQWLSVLMEVHHTLGQPAAHALSCEAYIEAEAARRAALCEDLGDMAAGSAESVQRGGGHAWGVLYALNGSAIGASVLLKSGRIPGDWPTSYLLCMQEFARSKALKTFFAELDAQSFDMDDARCGAERVFSMFSRGQ